MESMQKANVIINQFQKRIADPLCPGKLRGRKLFTGVDLGTAYIVLAVVDEEGNPVAGAMRFAQVVRDGLVIDYMGAIKILKSLKDEIEGKLGTELYYAGVAYPPGTSRNDRRVITNVAEAAGLEVLLEIDEPTAANAVLGITNGAVIDIGGGTTGIALFAEGKVIYVADEPTGGTHFSLVISGAYKISFAEAEKRKKDPRCHLELLPTVKPVIQKVTSIVKGHLQKYSVEKLFLVGGTCCLQNIEKIMADELGIAVVKPSNPLLVTPLGIALSVKQTHQERVEK